MPATNDLKSIIKILQDNKPAMSSNFGVNELALFGSFVRGTQKTKSDIDISVQLGRGFKTFDNFMELKFFLNTLLGRKIDLVIKESIRKELKSKILKEAIHV